MTNKLRVCIVLLVANLLSSCQNESSSPHTAIKASEPTAERLGKMEAELASLKARVDLLSPEDPDVIKKEEATVSTEENAYSIARTSFGVFPIVCRSVVPYLDGFKVKMAIGNTTSAFFHGAKLHLKWGPQWDSANVDAYLKDQKEKEVDVTKVFRPGTYTLIEVPLTPARPEEIKSFTLGLEFNQLSLR